MYPSFGVLQLYMRMSSDLKDLILLAGYLSPVKGDARCLSTLFHLQWTGTPVVDSRWPAWWSHTGFSKASRRAWMGRRGGSHDHFLVSSTWRLARRAWLFS